MAKVRAEMCQSMHLLDVQKSNPQSTNKAEIESDIEWDSSSSSDNAIGGSPSEPHATLAVREGFVLDIMEADLKRRKTDMSAAKKVKVSQGMRKVGEYLKGLPEGLRVEEVMSEWKELGKTLAFFKE